MECLIIIVIGLIIAAIASNAQPDVQIKPEGGKYPQDELPPVNPNVEDTPSYSYTCIAYVNLQYYFANYDYETKEWDYTEIGSTMVEEFHNEPDFWIPLFEEYTGLSIEGNFHKKRQKY